jgi:hypothetical protein
MKINVTVDLNLKTGEALEKCIKAAREAMRDTVVDITRESMIGTPKKTGYNMNSLAGEVSGMGVIIQGPEAKPDKVVDDSKIQGAVFSTSGYGGFLETGTVKMAARPYVKPAADKNVPKFPEHMKKHLLGVT